MNVAVVGLGNIGTVFAAHLAARANHRVYACVRRQPDPLCVDGSFGQINAEVEWFDSPERVPTADWILLATKSHQTDEAASLWFRHLVQSGSRIVVLQNGVDATARLAPLSYGAPVIPTIVYTNAKRLGLGHVRHMQPGCDLGVPQSPEARALIELFNGTEIRIQEESDFVTAAWRKFLINLVANPFTAISGRGIGVLRSEEVERAATRLLDEAAAVGRAEGAKLAPEIGREVLAWIRSFPGDTGTSMLEDRLAGRKLEVDAMTGTVLALGARHGVDMPANQTVMAVLRVMGG